LKVNANALTKADFSLSASGTMGYAILREKKNTATIWGKKGLFFFGS